MRGSKPERAICSNLSLSVIRISGERRDRGRHAPGSVNADDEITAKRVRQRRYICQKFGLRPIVPTVGVAFVLDGEGFSGCSLDQGAEVSFTHRLQRNMGQCHGFSLRQQCS